MPSTVLPAPTPASSCLLQAHHLKRLANALLLAVFHIEELDAASSTNSTPAGTRAAAAIEAYVELKRAFAQVANLSLGGDWFLLLADPGMQQAAASLANALRALWKEKREQAERAADMRRRMALAAATRPCANLRCPSLGAGCPGPQGKKCSVCKMPRYCCEQCQREDWKEGGHRRACKLLRQ